MARFDLADNATFPQLVERITEVSRPFAPMWPSYWIKAAAVRDGATWHLCQFYLVGRWSSGEPIRQTRDRGDAIALVNYQVSASEAWSMLGSLAQEGQVSLLPGVVAMAPAVTIPNVVGTYWNEPVHHLPPGIADVIEQAPWRCLHIGYTAQWLMNDFDTQTRLLRAIQPDLDQRNARGFEALLTSRFGTGPHQANQYSLGMFGYIFDLPLALYVEHGTLDRQTSRLRLTMRCRPPLAVDTLQVAICTNPAMMDAVSNHSTTKSSYTATDQPTSIPPSEFSLFPRVVPGLRMSGNSVYSKPQEDETGVQ